MRFFTLFRKSSLTAVSILMLSGANAQEPQGYYDQASGLSGADLKTALHQIIKGGSRLGYGSGSGNTWSGFEKTDLHPEGYVWDMYSNNKVPFPGGGKAASGMNIEHSVAKSWWGGTKNFAYRDLYHLNPSNSAANTARSNYPPGIVKNGTTTGTIKVGSNSFGSEYNDICFEPLDEYKGDFARAYMYMFTCYEDLSWTGTKAPTMLKNERYPMLRPWAADLLLEWSRMDPVSDKEHNRAEEVYKIQDNRNPFIDHPELAEYLWGEHKGEPYFFTEVTDPILTKPSRNAVFTFKDTHYESQSTIEINVAGRNLTSDLRFEISGEDASLFELGTTRVNAEEVINGFNLNVTFHPVKAGLAQAIIIIRSDEFEERNISIEALATEQFAALEPQFITHNSFDAVWTSSSLTNQFDLNVYQKKSTIQENVLIEDASFKGSMASGWSATGYSSFNDDKEGVRLASSGDKGVLTSPEMDLSTGGTLKFKAKQWSSDGIVNVIIQAEGKELGEIMLSKEYAEYEISLPSLDVNTEISFTALKGKRLFISTVSIYSGGETIENVSLEGFPIRIANEKRHTITNLDENSDYYYKVTPVYEGAIESAEIHVRTAITNDLSDIITNEPKIYIDGGQILIQADGETMAIRIIDLNGAILKNEKSIVQEWRTNLDHAGIYFIQIITTHKQYIQKIIIQ